jgi:YfiH family protein
MPKLKFIPSPLFTKLNIKHGFFQKYGGVSAGHFKSLNVKKGIGDSDENIKANLDLALSELKLSENRLFFIRHNFKDNILVVDDNMQPGDYQGCDAVITNRKDAVLAQGIADCANIMLSDKNKTFVGLIHGSWHTTKLNIVSKTIKAASELYGVKPADILVSFGPMLCFDCFEFGSEAPSLFENRYLKPKGGKYRFNNKQKIIDQLLASGVQKANIWDSETCTFESEDYFSYRKAKSRGLPTGRFLSLISL